MKITKLTNKGLNIGVGRSGRRQRAVRLLQYALQWHDHTSYHTALCLSVDGFRVSGAALFRFTPVPVPKQAESVQTLTVPDPPCSIPACDAHPSPQPTQSPGALPKAPPPPPPLALSPRTRATKAPASGNPLDRRVLGVLHQGCQAMVTTWRATLLVSIGQHLERRGKQTAHVKIAAQTTQARMPKRTMSFSTVTTKARQCRISTSLRKSAVWICSECDSTMSCRSWSSTDIISMTGTTRSPANEA